MFLSYCDSRSFCFQYQKQVNYVYIYFYLYRCSLISPNTERHYFFTLFIIIIGLQYLKLFLLFIFPIVLVLEVVIQVDIVYIVLFLPLLFICILSFCSPKIFIFSFVPSFDVKKTNILCIFPAFRDTVTVSTILLRLSIGSVICCVYLAYILYFVLHDFCIVCVSTYVVNVVNLVLCAVKLQVLRDRKSDATTRAKCD